MWHSNPPGMISDRKWNKSGLPCVDGQSWHGTA